MNNKTAQTETEKTTPNNTSVVQHKSNEDCTDTLRRSPPRQSDRKLDAVFKSSKCNLAVEVWRITGFRPRFRCVVGTIGNDNKFFPGISFRCKEENYKVEVEAIDTDELASLMKQAHNHVLNERQKREDQIYDHDTRHERKGLEHKKKFVRDPGKTAREKETGKAASHQSNLQRRAEEDRSRQSNAGKR